MYPDRFFFNLWNRIPCAAKWAFFSCMATGISAHFYMFANKLPNYDDINNLTSYGAGVSSGRFFLDFLGRCVLYFFGNFSMPWLYGVLSVFFLSIASAVIVCILNIRGKLNCFLIGTVLPVFPAMTATFFFMYTTPYYAFGICLTAISVLVVNESSNIFGFLASTVMLALSLGIYQAYIPLAAGIMILLFIKKCLSLTPRYFLADMVRYFLLLAVSLGLYLVLNKVALYLYGQEMDTYKGLDQMGRVSLQQLIGRIKITYYEFFQYFLKDRDGINPYPTMRFLSTGIYLLSIAGICTGIVKISRTKSTKSLLPCLGLTAAIIVFPLAANGIYLLAEASTVYSIMRYPLVLIYILAIMVLDWMQYSGFAGKGVQVKVRANIVACWLGTAAIFCTVCSNIYYANTQYLAMDMQYKQAYSYFTSMITAIKLTDGYDAELPLVIIGDRIEDPSFYRNEDFEGYGMSGRSATLLNEYSRDVFWKKYNGFNHRIIEDKSAWESLPMVQAMPCYPQNGSIQVIDGAIVLKLQETD